MSDFWDVVVVGSCMIDLVCYAPRLPKSGETLKGTDFCTGFGGKGCNQCVAARKLGSRTLLIARVGDDSFGANYVAHLRRLDIPTDPVRITKDVTTGMAQITVADSGENQIVIVPGANDHLTEKDLMDGSDHIRNCKVLMCQMEINREITKKAMEIKSKSGIGKTIFNGAPAVADLEPTFFSLPDVFCVNESEAEIFTGIHVSNIDEARQALFKLMGKGCREVIITLGEQGALYGVSGRDETVHVPVEKVSPVDTTGAGDSFIGALGFYMARHPEMTMPEMIRKSCDAAALSVQRKGTQESFPSFVDLKQCR